LRFKVQDRTLFLLCGFFALRGEKTTYKGLNIILLARCVQVVTLRGIVDDLIDSDNLLAVAE
jgi:hypothetical protein